MNYTQPVLVEKRQIVVQNCEVFDGEIREGVIPFFLFYFSKEDYRREI